MSEYLHVISDMIDCRNIPDNVEVVENLLRDAMKENGIAAANLHSCSFDDDILVATVVDEAFSIVFRTNVVNKVVFLDVFMARSGDPYKIISCIESIILPDYTVNSRVDRGSRDYNRRVSISR